jgi:hypothetical protein
MGFLKPLGITWWSIRYFMGYIPSVLHPGRPTGAGGGGRRGVLHPVFYLMSERIGILVYYLCYCIIYR